ncbi:MAG: STAS domain-containing protein [Rhodanobacteraceae bacterium]|nr:STAS domain-containing protein [Rhodanobacteraceae bacterium]
MAIELACGQQGQVHIVALGGRLDADGAVDLELGLQELEAQGARHFVVDAAGLTYASSSGLKSLAAFATRIARAKGSVRLGGVPPALQAVFKDGLPQQVPTYVSRAAALAAHPAIGVDAGLLQAVTRLVGADAIVPSGGEATELGEAAARLLDAKAPPGQPEVPRQPRAPTPLPPSREAERDAEPDPGSEEGLGSKLRRLLGPK